MEHFIIILLSILVLIILALYIHKVIMYNHIQEEIQVVFNNLANINSFINSKLDIKEQSQSQNTTLDEITLEREEKAIKFQGKLDYRINNPNYNCKQCKYLDRNLIPCIECSHNSLFESNDKIVESFEVEHDIKKDDNVMVNIITNKVVEDIKDNERNIVKHWCDNCKYEDLSSQYEPCNTCISEGISKICK